MSKYHDEENTKYNKTKIQSIQSIQSNRIEKEPKVNASFYMRKSIADAGRVYARRAGLAVGDFVEQSLILFMDINPIEFFGVNVLEPQRRQTTLEDKMGEMIALSDLEEWLEETRKLVQDGVTVHRSRIKSLLGIIRDCRKINNRSKRLDELIEEAILYVTESHE